MEFKILHECTINAIPPVYLCKLAFFRSNTLLSTQICTILFTMLCTVILRWSSQESQMDSAWLIVAQHPAQWLHLEEFLGHLSFRTPVQVEQWSTSENSIIMFSNAIKDSHICLKNEGSRSTFAMHLFFYLKHKCIFNILFLCAPSNLHNYLGLTDYRNTINVVFDKDEYVGRT